MRTDFDLTVCCATYGAQSWQELAESRAVPSAMHQAPVVRVHQPDGTLATARNYALEQVASEFVAFVDGDDYLAPDFVEQMAKGTCDVRAPAVSYVRKFRQPRPAGMPKVAGHEHDCTAECVTSGAGNWLVIGTVVKTGLVREAGGFKDWDCYEDFDLWMRVLLLGATLEALPEAVYYAVVRPDSRNRAPHIRDKNRVHHAIVAANLPQAA
jgi:glycosyltransferase involved in cell wall biosynthesis